MSGKYKELFPDFVKQLDEKMQRGFEKYSDKTFDRPLKELIPEIRQELLDIFGWAFFIWIKLDELEKKMENIYNEKI